MTTATQPAPGQTSRYRVLNITLWVLQIVTAAAFVLAATAKLGGAAPVVAAFDAIGFGDWFRYLIGVLEVAGAVALLIPRLAGLAGLAFAGLTVGALITHLTVLGNGAAMVLPFLVLSAVIAWGRWRSTAQLWALLSR